MKSAEGIWGMDTWDTQQEISRRVIPGLRHGEWADVADDNFTTQVPAVVTAAAWREKIKAVSVPAPWSRITGGAMRFWRGLRFKKSQGHQCNRYRRRNHRGSRRRLWIARLWFKQFQWNVDNPREAKGLEPGAIALSAVHQAVEMFQTEGFL